MVWLRNRLRTYTQTAVGVESLSGLIILHRGNQLSTYLGSGCVGESRTLDFDLCQANTLFRMEAVFLYNCMHIVRITTEVCVSGYSN